MMKSIPRLIRRFIGILLISILLILLSNIVLLMFTMRKQTASGHPYSMAAQAGQALKKTENGYEMDKALARQLEKENVWAACIDDASRTAVWKSRNAPADLPKSFTLYEISRLTLGYFKDDAVYIAQADGGIMMLGYPKGRYWKMMTPTWDFAFIAGLPKTVLCAAAVNLALFFLIYMAANSGLLRAVRPIVEGIQALASGEYAYVREQGVLCELAANINQTAEILQRQNRRLRKKETARANWIAGVSHDIRTPLSMVMGCAARLEEDESLNGEQRKKAAVIVRQSRRMRSLISDLNLASRLEYNMQPLHPVRQNITAAVRQAAADFINMETLDRHEIIWEGQQASAACYVSADTDLIKRAVSNLIQNSISHNEDGCTVYVSVQCRGKECVVSVADDGAGVSDEKLEKIRSTPHYMESEEHTLSLSHGLGLLIVRQTAASHHGSVTFGHSSYGGFLAELTLPLDL